MKLIDGISTELQHSGYLIDLNPQIPAVQALLYARSSKRVQMAFAKVEDHFLFVDGNQSELSRPEQLKDIYRHFSEHVNHGFHVPRGWRITIPNLAVIAISQAEFPAEIADFARTTSLTPWIGGEVGQVILVEIDKKQVTSLVSLGSGRYPRPGALPLGHAARVIRQVCDQVFVQA